MIIKRTTLRPTIITLTLRAGEGWREAVGCMMIKTHSRLLNRHFSFARKEKWPVFYARQSPQPRQAMLSRKLRDSATKRSDQIIVLSHFHSGERHRRVSRLRGSVLALVKHFTASGSSSWPNARHGRPTSGRHPDSELVKATGSPHEYLYHKFCANRLDRRRRARRGWLTALTSRLADVRNQNIMARARHRWSTGPYHVGPTVPAL